MAVLASDDDHIDGEPIASNERITQPEVGDEDGDKREDAADDRPFGHGEDNDGNAKSE